LISHRPRDAAPATADGNREAVARHDIGDRQDERIPVDFA
jgi:hypothetical protein